MEDCRCCAPRLMTIALSIGGRFALSMWLIHLRKGFNSVGDFGCLVYLEAQEVRNKCAFDGCNSSLAAALRLAREEDVCWSLAGAKAVFLPYRRAASLV